MSESAVLNLTKPGRSIPTEELSADHPEVIERQATVNIGTIGHVAHGKTTVVKALSGKSTVRFRVEIERNCTVKLGYANTKIFKCSNEECLRPGNYAPFNSSTNVNPRCTKCGSEMHLVRHVSFVDCFSPETEVLDASLKPRRVDTLAIGDKLIGPDGTERVVRDVKTGQKDLFKIKYVTSGQNGAEPDGFTCTGGHLLVLRIDTPVQCPVFVSSAGKFVVRTLQGNSSEISSSTHRFDTEAEAKEFYESCSHDPIVFEITVEQYLTCPVTIREKARLIRTGPIEFPAADLALAIGTATAEEVAYLVGLWLGDGDASSPRFTFSSDETEVIDRVTDIAQKMGLTAVLKKYSDRNAVWITLSTVSGPARNQTEACNENEFNPFYLLLKNLNMIGNKHLPAALRLHSRTVREAIIAGLVDSDGHYANGQFDLEQSEEAHAVLFWDFVRLLRSCGFIAHVSRQSRTANDVEHVNLRVRFNGTASRLPIASPKKQGSDIQRAWAYSQQFTVESIGNGDFFGFETDGDHKIVLADGIVAHNCPGHDVLMSTMISGAAVMDAALLLVAGNEACPQPQTSEHLAAVEIMKLKHILVLQNKIDLVSQEAALAQQKDIRQFMSSFSTGGSPIIPISAQLNYNVDAVCDFIHNKIPLPQHDFTGSPRMIVIRSFDVNKPGTTPDRLQGGVAGGSLLRGVLRLGDRVEIRPGVVKKTASGLTCRPIFTEIRSLFAESNQLAQAVPGGLIGLGTSVDPYLTRQDRLVGHLVGSVGTLPAVYTEVSVKFTLLSKLLGVKMAGSSGDIAELEIGEYLLVNIGSLSTGAKITSLDKEAKVVSFELAEPVCADFGEKIALSRRIEKHWRLIGWAELVGGVEAPVEIDE